MPTHHQLRLLHIANILCFPQFLLSKGALPYPSLGLLKILPSGEMISNPALPFDDEREFGLSDYLYA